MKFKIMSVVFCFAVIFFSGISIAYYNTRTFGFDENAKVFSYDDQKFSFFDYIIYYDDIDNAIEKARSFIPDEQYILAQNDI